MTKRRTRPVATPTSAPVALVLAATLWFAVGSPAPAAAEGEPDTPLILNQDILKDTTREAVKDAVSKPAGDGKAKGGPQPEPPTLPAPARQHTPTLPRDGRDKAGPQPEPPTVKKPPGHGASSLPPSHQRPAQLPSGRPGANDGPAIQVPLPDGARKAPGFGPAGVGHATEAIQNAPILVRGPAGCVRTPSTLSIEVSNPGQVPAGARLALRPAGGGAPVARPPVRVSGRSVQASLTRELQIPGGDYRVALEDRDGGNVGGSVPVTFCATGSMSARVELSGCSAGAGEISVVAEPYPSSGSPASYPLGRVATGSDLELVYRRDDIPLRRIKVTPRLPDGRCPGGAWIPESLVFVLSEGDPSINMGFRYSVGAQETRISANQVATLVELALSGIEIRLNNYDPSRSGNSRFLAGDSFVAMPDHLGGRRTGISIPEQGSDAFKYYVRDVDSVSHNVTTDGDAFRLRFVFESRGDEIKGHCFGGAVDGCLVGRDDSAPDGSLDNLRLDVRLRPIRFTPAGGGPASLTFEVSGLDMDFDLDLNGLAGGLEGVVTVLLRSRVLPEARDKVGRSIDDFDTRGQIAAQLRRILAEHSVGDVESVAIEGNELVVVHRPPG